MQERIFLTKEQAFSCLKINNDDTVHTLTDTGLTLLGFDMPIEVIREKLDNADKIEIAGDMARNISHGIVILFKNRRNEFLQTDEEKLSALEKSLVKTVVTKSIRSISQVCASCGISANVLTCLKKRGRCPEKLAFSASTFHDGKCDYCGEVKPVTEVRDFFYPDFSLIDKYVKKSKN